MIDDVMSFVKIAEVLKERGAYKIYAMATHGLLSSDAPRLIEDSCIDEVSLSIIFITIFYVIIRYMKIR
jgi:phosphoribosylpyrophosphate synthetase